MALIKTLDPQNRLVAVSGIPIPAGLCAPVCDIVDQLNTLLPTDPPAVTGVVAAGSPLAQLIAACAAAGIITNSTTSS